MHFLAHSCISRTWHTIGIQQTADEWGRNVCNQSVHAFLLCVAEAVTTPRSPKGRVLCSKELDKSSREAHRSWSPSAPLPARGQQCPRLPAPTSSPWAPSLASRPPEPGAGQAEADTEARAEERGGCLVRRGTPKCLTSGSDLPQLRL